VVETNVANGLPPLAVERRKARFLTVPEADALQAAADRENPRLGALVMLMLATGARRGEAEAITWGDVGVEGVTISKSLRNRREVGPTKSGEERTVPVGPDTVRALAAWRLRSGVPDAGAPVAGAYDRKAWERARAAAGLGGLTLHDLRHTAATWWLAAGVTIHAVADLLGHSDATLVLRLYGHAMPNDLGRAGEAMDSWRRQGQGRAGESIRRGSV
jgi:integrase